MNVLNIRFFAYTVFSLLYAIIRHFVTNTEKELRQPNDNDGSVLH